MREQVRANARLKGMVRKAQDEADAATASAQARETEVVELRPRPWGGRGLLGCHIRPYEG